MPFGLDGSKGGTFPSWTTAGRPSPATAGQTGYNSTLNTLETYNGSAWGPVITTITPGAILQVVNASTSAVATGTGIIPFDDTIPQNTEGTEFLTATITPKSSTSKLFIQFNGYAAPSTAVFISTAIFQDSTANALAANSSYMATAGGNTILNLNHFMTSGTTSTTTFKIRIGPNSAATVTLNGQGGGRIFGGVSATSITITEIAA